ncbi:hypothetical protein ISCGN_031154 [Ixodes scapularis]
MMRCSLFPVCSVLVPPSRLYALLPALVAAGLLTAGRGPDHIISTMASRELVRKPPRAASGPRAGVWRPLGDASHEALGDFLSVKLLDFNINEEAPQVIP